jgi:polyhydroxyalkanoate synthesis regulator phasin
MKGPIIKTCSGSLLALILALSSISISCGDSRDPVKIPIARSAFTIQDGPTAQMARDISKGMGSVVAAGNGGGNRIVIAFEETHTSRAGQIEIATMLLRLHKKYNLQRVSLEGAIVGDAALTPGWFHELTTTLESNRDGQQLAVRMLKDGEINCGEFTSLVLRDVHVNGNEKAEEYNVELSDRASQAVSNHLVGLVEKSLPQSKISEINRLSNQGKEDEAADLLFGSDPWVKEHYEKLSDKGDITSVEESVKVVQEIEAKAKDSGIAIQQQDTAGLQDMIKFFKTAVQRSSTMVANTLAMCDESPKTPVGFIIGAAHTAGVLELLKAGDASFAIISPNSLSNKLKSGALTMDAYKRKNEKKSVDSRGFLGAYLNRRHKPPVVIGETWYRTKSEIGLLAIALAAAAEGGEGPPFDSLKDRFKKFRNITVDTSSFELIKKDSKVWAIGNIEADTGAGKIKLCVGGAKQPPPPNGPTSATGASEERDPYSRLLIWLTQALNEAKNETNDKDKPDPGPAVVTQLTTDTQLAIAQSSGFMKSLITK